MKRLWIAGGILASVFSLTLFHGFYLARFTEEVSGLLEQAGERAGAGDWAAAEEYNRRAYDRWEAGGVYLHILLRHDGTDAVDVSFHEAAKYLQCREAGEYSAVNARLKVQLESLSEAERLTWENIL